jgi:lipoprotein-anchoring transpeptidase ErfK/SrfK
MLLGIRQKLQSHMRQRVIKRLTVVCGSVVVCFVLFNVTVYALFLHRTYPNSRIANFSVGMVNYSDLTGRINNLHLLPKTIKLSQHGQNSYLSPAQLGIQIDNTKLEESIKNRSWLPLMNFFVSHDSSVTLKVNQANLANKLASLEVADSQAPTNAKIVMQNGQFLLKSSTNGYQLSTPQAAKAIVQALSEGKTNVSLPFTSTAPSITSASLSRTLHQLQSQQNDALNYTYNGKASKPTASDIANWYSLVNNVYVPQSSKIQSYITQVGASDGILVQNMNSVIAATVSALQKNSAVTLALVAVPPTECSTNTLSQFVLVNITDQHMWACQGPDLVYDSPVTTGAYQVSGDATPTGTWHIYAKERDTHLIGPTWDDFVNYWLPFYSDYGFHDATWQTFPFGGPEYPTEGSHGCVHLPLTAMAWLYNWSKIGTTVTVTQ